jgi:HSP20 family protein
MVEKTDHSSFWPSLYDPIRNFGARIADWLSPASEASGGERTYDISMELPGVSEDDVELTLEGDMLTVRGEKRTHEERKGDTWFFSERQYGAFRRSFRLPEDAETQGVSAHMKDGVLHISIPRREASPKASVRKIDITRG